MFHVDRINVFYGDVQVLWDVSLRVEPGEIVAVIGSNGSGKSTLLRTLINLNRPQKSDPNEGGIYYQGHRIDGLSPEETVKLGMTLVPEGARVFQEMNVIENLKMGSYLKRAKETRRQTLEEVYALFPRLKERRSQKAVTLSGGERQMLALGMALMSKPNLLLLDEPSLGLQPNLVTRTFEAVQKINQRGITILLVEQNIQYSLNMCHRAYVLENGRIILEGKGRELLGSPHVRKAYLAL